MDGRGHRRLWVLLSAVGALLVGMIVWLVVSTTGAPTTRSPVEDTTTKVVTASDGHSAVTVPGRWAQMPKDLQIEGAVIAQAQIYQERYLMVLSDDKARFTDFADYEDTATKSMDAMVTAVGQPVELSIGGLRAVRSEYSGDVDGVSVVYWSTVVEGTRAYHQIITWTLTERRDEAEPALRTVVETFRER